MSFEQDYNKLVSYSKDAISNNNIGNILAEDVVNDTYIYLIENNIDYTFDVAKKKILNLIITEKQINHGTALNTSEKYHTGQQVNEEKYCKKCDEVKPISAFYSWISKKLNCRRYRHICIDCVTKEQEKYRRRIGVISRDEFIKKINQDIDSSIFYFIFKNNGCTINDISQEVKKTKWCIQYRLNRLKSSGIIYSIRQSRRTVAKYFITK